METTTMTNTTTPANPAPPPATQTPEYLALADACRKMVDAFCAKSDNRQRAAAGRILDLLGEREIPVDEILDDLRITKNEGRRSAGGRWVSGTLARHEFQALVFAEHAENPEYEMYQSRISKLWLRDLLTNEVVCEFDRGWSISPRTQAARHITDLLADGLADHIFGG
ncbi:MAG: hypothetical protein IT438_15030 [Phycisphaerales bacterium]|nr:hypothetical protein [Phycisphaerales bacterium]